MPLVAGKTYQVATNDFMARGGDGYITFQNAEPLLPASDSPLMANEVIDYIKSIGTVRANAEGRIVLK